jgi:hypothetical protein
MLLGIMLTTIEADITSGTCNVRYKFRWTLNTCNIEEINSFAKQTGLQTTFSFINDIYPLFSDRVKEICTNVFGRVPKLGVFRRRESSIPLTTNFATGSLQPVPSEEEMSKTTYVSYPEDQNLEEENDDLVTADTPRTLIKEESKILS